MPLESARNAIHQHHMMRPGDRVLVAVSGGLDSVVLLDILHRLSSEIQIDLIVGHVDHGLRSDESAQDAAFVADLGRSLGLPLRLHQVEASEFASARGQGREGAARQVRLQALRRMADEAGAERIALGHTVDDRAETIIHRLARGTGPLGLRGILPMRLPFVRPLIHTSREAIMTYATDRRLAWREDASNRDLSLSRNRIRHRVLPELVRINPQAVQAIGRAADLVTDLTMVSQRSIDQALTSSMISASPDAIRCSRGAIRALPQAAERCVVREGLRLLRGDLSGITHQHVESVRALINSPRAHAEISLPGVRVAVEYDVLVLRPSGERVEASWDHPIDLGDNPLPRQVTLRAQVFPRTELRWNAVRTSPWVEAMDADHVSFPLHLRTRRPGDRFTPLGMSHPQKLKDFLMKAHIPASHRDKLPLLCAEDQILWVVGVRLSNNVRITDDTKRVLLLQMEGMA